MQAKWVDECQAGVAHNWAKVGNQGDINHIQAARQSLSVMTNDDLVLDVLTRNIIVIVGQMLGQSLCHKDAAMLAISVQPMATVM